MTEWYPTTGAISLPPRGRVAVIGGGNWGTTFAKIIADGGNDVTLAVRRPELADDILAHAAEFKAAHGGTLE